VKKITKNFAISLHRSDEGLTGVKNRLPYRKNNAKIF
jgi:hypothetical protein